MHCPNCNSTDINYQIFRNKMSLLQSLVIFLIFLLMILYGVVGIIIGLTLGLVILKLTSKKETMYICNDCGKKFKIE